VNFARQKKRKEKNGKNDHGGAENAEERGYEKRVEVE
jgi:hypothetical protein